MDQPTKAAPLSIDDELARRAGLSVVVLRRAPGLPLVRCSGALAIERGGENAIVGSGFLADVVSDEDHRRVERALLRGTEDCSIDVALRGERERWLRLHARPGDPEERERGIITVYAQDISEQRAAGVRQDIRRAWTRAIARHAPVILFGVDAHGVFTHFEHHVSGGEIGERYDVVGHAVSEVFAELPEHLAALSRALSGERISERMQHRGEIFELHCEVLDIEDGRGTRVLGAIINVTRQVLIDQALAENKSQLESIIHTVADGILLNDVSGRIKFANTRLASLLGVRPEDMLGKHIFDFMDEESANEARANLKRRRSGHFDRFDHRWLRADGTALWSVVAAKPMYGADGEHQGSLVTVTDITERKLAEEALKKARDELEHRVVERTAELASANKLLQEEVRTRTLAQETALRESRVKSAFLASMSHELRTPLNAIIGYNEMIIEDIDDTGSGAEFRMDLQRVLFSSRHLLSLINDVLDLSKIEAAKVEIELSSFRLGDMLRELEATTRPLALKNNNVARVECTERDASARVTSDRTKLRQILLNLLGNACKFTSNGEIVLRAKIAGRGEIDWLELAVIDTGVGIAMEQQERIFEAFAQTEEGREVKYGGTGLGLTISKRLCEMLGGEIGVKSVIGRGTTFSVAIPLRRRSSVGVAAVTATRGASAGL